MYRLSQTYRVNGIGATFHLEGARTCKLTFRCAHNTLQNKSVEPSFPTNGLFYFVVDFVTIVVRRQTLASTISSSLKTEDAPTQLLQLPSPCLLAVLQCCTGDLRSLFSAARAHPRLNQAAVEVLSSISVDGITQQQQLDSVLLYLLMHGKHVHSLDLAGAENVTVSLRDLPHNLHLDSLVLSNLTLQMQPSAGRLGVVHPNILHKQLRLSRCKLIDGIEGLAAALALLPGLQHLSISGRGMAHMYSEYRGRFPAHVLPRLKKLTYLEIDGVTLQGVPALQPVQGLNLLADLRLSVPDNAAVKRDMLSGLQHLTRLEVGGGVKLEANVLSDQTQLQHLKLALSGRSSAAIGGTHWQVLPELQPLQQLTHLGFHFGAPEDSSPPTTAFSALTASSRLQCLELILAYLQLPAAAWEQMFPVGKQLVQMQALHISCICDLFGFLAAIATAPEATRLVSCCPNLQRLNMQGLQYSAEQLVGLQGLSRLHTLLLMSSNPFRGHSGRELQAVAQLTGLQELRVQAPQAAEGLLLQLTQLKQLTRLDVRKPLRAGADVFLDITVMTFRHESPDDEPVWRQVLQHHHGHKTPDPLGAEDQQAATTLDTSEAEDVLSEWGWA